MSENTKIEWADHTFNPWVGCTKVGPGCDHCYAEGWAKRSGSVTWGGDRRRTTDANWRKPLKWQANAAEFMAQHGRRQRVFCASLADVFDNQVDPAWRLDLFKLIAATPDLDWLLVTKRIGNARPMMDAIARAQPIPGRLSDSPVEWQPMDNLWLGITVVNQAEADRGIPKLLQVPARVRFLSVEPLLGPVNLHPWLCLYGNVEKREQHMGPCCTGSGQIHWVIVGGESGPGARPMHPDWARSLRDQCAVADVPFLFKQWGKWGPFVNEDHYTHGGAEKHAHAWVDAETADHGLCWLIDDDGSWSNWTGEPRPMPAELANDDGGTLHPDVKVMGDYGKKAAGRLLDGVEHNGFPEVAC